MRPAGFRRSWSLALASIVDGRGQLARVVADIVTPLIAHEVQALHLLEKDMRRVGPILDRALSNQAG